MTKKLDVGVMVRVIASGLDPRTIGMTGIIEKYDPGVSSRPLALLLNIGPWLVDLPQMRNLMCVCGQHKDDGKAPFHSHEIIPIDNPDKQEETLEDVILELEKA